MSLFQSYDVDEDLRRESMDERRARRRMWHWCETCHGFTGPDSPCYSGDEERSEVVGHPTAPRETCNQSTEGDLK